MTLTKLNKDQVQKIALSTLGFIGLIYFYFNFFLGPLNRSRETMSKTIGELQAKTASSISEMKKTDSLEAQAREATTRYEAFKQTTADGAPIAWFPPKMRTFFGDQGIDKATVRLESTADFPQSELSDWLKDGWVIDLPQSEYGVLGKAIAELENTEALLSVQRVSIRGIPDEPQYQQVTLYAQTVFLKK
jgi:hypothetical protein